uniref:Uncharacterized protein n=1 Tax=Salix viminalis TaxID=40686 RepID=A0A6N2M4E7_SALVM
MVRGIGQMDSAGEGVGLVFLTLALCTTAMFEQCQGRSVYEEPANCLRLECAPYQLPQHNLHSAVLLAKNPPLSRQVHPVKMPEHRHAAVKRFGGFMNEANIPRQVLALRRSLKGSPWESSIAKTQSKGHVPCSVAGYNSPYEHENRVNEVMFWF